MNIQQDFEELLSLLRHNEVDFVVVGGYAVAFHGSPRFTKDIDIFYNNTDVNVSRIRKSLMEFGFSESDIPESSFTKEGNIVSFGVEPMRVDLLNRIDGVTFSEAVAGRIEGKYGKAEIFFIGKKELLKNKTSTSRLKDKMDAENLS
jgi:hypothetical protein